jgi:glycerol-3-phosphate dehydrogenase
MTFTRQHHLDAIKGRKEPFDFIIVGGGATGLGAAVDAASRGHSVALIEMADFAKGTSSRSTKLVHGGVRYLKQGNVSLVLEALRERGRLAKNAPHLAHDLAFVIPNYKWWEGPFYGIGMKVYDQLAGKLGLGPSRMLSRDETIEAIPTVETEHLTGGVIYHDGQFDDSRLAIDLAQTAADHGALLANYVRCVGLVKDGKFVHGIRARDEETGAEFTLHGRAIINATGVFVDDLRKQDQADSKAIVSVSQGVHIVLPKEFLPGKAAIMIPKTADGRVLFAVPWHDHVVVGTTDTPLPEHDLEPRALPEEVQFIMEHCAKYLTRDPKPEDVLSIYAGLRPLVKAGDGQDTAALSRDHTILISDSGLITVTGGKWTTYRKMGEDVIDQAEMVAGVENRPCYTVNLQIHGWTHQPIPEPHLQVYGSFASEIRGMTEADPSLANRVHPQLTLTRAEVLWHVRREMARTVEDVLARRSRSLLLNARASQEAAREVAAIMAPELGHDEAWQAAQVEQYTRLSQGYIFGTPESTQQPSARS